MRRRPGGHGGVLNQWTLLVGTLALVYSVSLGAPRRCISMRGRWRNADGVVLCRRRAFEPAPVQPRRQVCSSSSSTAFPGRDSMRVWRRLYCAGLGMIARLEGLARFSAAGFVCSAREGGSGALRGNSTTSDRPRSQTIVLTHGLAASTVTWRAQVEGSLHTTACSHGISRSRAVGVLKVVTFSRPVGICGGS
jgi:hypothetical protein